MDQAKLVQKAKKGDDDAFEQLTGSVRQKLYRTAYAYVRNEQDALGITTSFVPSLLKNLPFI